MRMSKQILLSRAKRRLKLVEYIDLSDLEIVAVECLCYCPSLQSLKLRNNYIDVVCNLTSCNQLWNIDLGNNRVTNLDGLSRFVALGLVNLSNNNLTWAELMKIRHIQILDLHLHGNTKLEADPNYRIHVVDSLHNIWMLDGRIITSNESIQVEHFFEKSSLSSHPVRHKLTKKQFVTTAMKRIQVEGSYGERTMHLMVRFPQVECLNVDTDIRRIKYLAFNLQRDLFLAECYGEWWVTTFNCGSNEDNLPCNFLEKLIECRPSDCERFNVLLLLLVASLEFSFPTILMEEAVKEAKLVKLSNVSTIHLFLLPRDIRGQICSLLLSAVKVDRDARKDDGLHDRLYLCLYYTITDIIKRMHARPDSSPKHVLKRIYRQYRGLLAAEVVQLFCIVPSFFDLMQNDPGVMQLVSAASGDGDMPQKVSTLMERIIESGGNSRRMVEEASELIMASIYENTRNVFGHKIPAKSQSRYVLSIQEAIPRRPMSTPLYSSSLLSEGRSHSAKSRKVIGLNPRKVVAKKAPVLGEKVLLGPQNLGFIIALPESSIALIQLENIPAHSGSMISKFKNHNDFYSYVNMKGMVFNGDFGYWKPKRTIGDRITMETTVETDFMPPNPPSSPQQGRSPKGSYIGLAVEPQTHPQNIPPSISEVLLEKQRNSVSSASTVKSIVSRSRDSLASDGPDKIQQVKQSTLSTYDSMNDESDLNSALYDSVRNAVETLNSNSKELTFTESISDVEQTKSCLADKSCSHCVMAGCVACRSQDSLHSHVMHSDSSKVVSKAHLTIDLRPDGEPTQTEIERIEMWDKSVKQNYKPRKRASSAYARYSTSMMQDYDNHRKSSSPVMIQMGNTWLAGGHDLHYITKKTNQMKLNHIPGWKQGLQGRPQSSKSFTERMQKKIRNINSAHPRLEHVASK
ncbi:uncharacterized protein LOC117110139 isoform X2 [Anneissia japonica]|uniref:uncharacterized protein LOC117110139 isoform X2 n=1 Tax=Anneissia japonica TaxID=1529436 RepID=UPI00142556B0|nr:uncharacterized protein LOC117110139 isoform X2 [Anneissia japonica]